MLAKLRLVRQIKQIFRQQYLIGNAGGGVFDKEMIFVSAEDDADRLVVTFDIFFLGEIIQVQVHLPNILMIDFAALEVDHHKAFQNAVIKQQVGIEMLSGYAHSVLAGDEGKAFA